MRRVVISISFLAITLAIVLGPMDITAKAPATTVVKRMKAPEASQGVAAYKS